MGIWSLVWGHRRGVFCSFSALFSFPTSSLCRLVFPISFHVPCQKHCQALGGIAALVHGSSFIGRFVHWDRLWLRTRDCRSGSREDRLTDLGSLCISFLSFAWSLECPKPSCRNGWRTRNNTIPRVKDMHFGRRDCSASTPALLPVHKQLI